MPGSNKLRWEIAATLLIKLVAIYFLWWMFFSEPVDENLTGSRVADVLFGDLPEQSPAEEIRPESSPVDRN